MQFTLVFDESQDHPMIRSAITDMDTRTDHNAGRLGKSRGVSFFRDTEGLVVYEHRFIFEMPRGLRELDLQKVILLDGVLATLAIGRIERGDIRAVVAEGHSKDQDSRTITVEGPTLEAVVALYEEIRTGGAELSVEWDPLAGHLPPNA